jgi:GWxTD domain-containing protein
VRFATLAQLSLSGLACSAFIARAQAPADADKLTPAAVAESLAVLKGLDGALRKNPNDAAAWYHRGMVAWALYERDRSKPPIEGLDWTRLGQMADTSFRLAATIDKDNAQYRMMAGRFLLNSGVSITRLASYGMFQASLDAARKADDPHVHAETAIEVGRLHWRRYDGFADRAPATAPDARRTCLLERHPTTVYRPEYIRPMIRDCLLFSTAAGNTDFAGEADYIEAEALFREAFDAQPSFERAYRQLAMLLVERNRWRELQVTARTRIAAAPWDAWAWLTLGLALHRQKGDAKWATAAFDSALAILPPEEVQRLNHLERVLKPADTTRMRAMDPATHAMAERWYWLSSDPLWAREGSEPRIEFLARLTYAELRWTAEEMNVRGADTDRGDVHIRYGPPDAIVIAHGSEHSPSELVTDWGYYNGLVFRFVGMPTFATAQVPPDDQAAIAEIQATAPARWDNIREFVVDSMPAQAVRFRAAQDSVDLYLATLPPIAQIRKSADVAGGVRSDFWVLTAGLVAVAHDSARLDVPGMSVHRRRVAPGTYVYRAEASADGGHYAARAGAMLVAGNDSATGFATRGFGMSDVLLAASASSRGTPLRWSDLDIQPLVGTVVQKGQIALVWENYELANERGAARYTVSVTVERQRSLAGRIATQFIGRVGSAVGIDRTNDDRVTMHYERNVPYAPALLDHVALGLGETPVGNYGLTVRIDDHVTGRTSSRGMNLRVSEK